ncbi:MAG: riboflavin synthase [Proteobacteria bacterium]|nr:riboflavin synthase [Cystobacterineae bacterium]MCL2314549.1 riboflavin synthase [Pseudomonadota bacterium]
MFTGLIEDIGRLHSMQPTVTRGGEEGGVDFWIEARFSAGTGGGLGESIACDGCCLTVVAWEGARFRVQASLESLRVTTLKHWKPGRRIHLERALALGARMGGHWLQGHVDEVVHVRESFEEGASRVLAVEMPKALAYGFVPKGSVALDGTSLTITRLDETCFWINLIPETLLRTHLGDKKPGDALNLEVDILAKYVARLATLGHLNPRQVAP